MSVVEAVKVVRTTGVEAFIDLGRHSQAISSIADWARVGVRGASYDNLARTLTNESKVLRNVLAAVEQHGDTFTGAVDVARGVGLLTDAKQLIDGTLQFLEDGGAKVMYKDVLGRKVRDASPIADELQRASTYIHDGFQALGGKRDVDSIAFETIDEAAKRGFDVSTLRSIDDPDPAWALPADHKAVRGRGHKVAQFVLRHTVQRAINMLAGVKVVEGHRAVIEGATILAPMHGSLFDPAAIGKLVPQPVRLMGNEKLFKGVKKHLLTMIGGFPVKHGDAIEGLATGRGILRVGGVIEMYPEGMILRHQGIGSNADGVARLALETGANVQPIAVYGLKPAKYRFERGRRRIASVAAGEVVRPGGAPATDRNIAIMRERIARSLDAANAVAKDDYDVRRAVSLGRKRAFVYAGASAATVGGGYLGVRWTVDKFRE